MITRDELARMLRDALANLYDPVRLQSHALGHVLALHHLDGETDSVTLRGYLRAKIDSLRPPRDTPQDASAWLGHQVLLLHYVRCLGPSDVCRDLNISQATFYRRQREALEALTSIIWDEHQEYAEAASPPDIEEPQGARQRAIALASRMPPQPIDLCALIEGVAQTVAPLAASEGLSLRVMVDPSMPQIWADATILRQALLALLSECVCRADGDTVEIMSRRGRKEVTGEICMPHTSGTALSGLVDSQPFKMGNELLQVYGGRAWHDTTKAGRPCVRFTIGVRDPQSILVVDDDQDTIDLYRRFLGRTDYVVRQANTAEEAEAELARAVPALVLLDVLLPRRDGWTILDTVRSQPATSQTPVIVCSVIEQPELAIALGATMVLNKPITEEQLLGAVRQVLQQADSQGRSHRAAP